MLHKFLSRLGTFSMVTLVSAFGYAHDGNDGVVTLNTPYSLWSNTDNGDVVRLSLDNGEYYNPSACTNVDSYMVSTAIPAEARQRIYSTLLSMKLAGKPVKLFVEGCEDGRPRVRNVIVN